MFKRRRRLSPTLTRQRRAELKVKNFVKGVKGSSALAVARINTSSNNIRYEKNINNEFKIGFVKPGLRETKILVDFSVDRPQSEGSNHVSHTSPNGSLATGLGSSTYTTESTEDVDINSELAERPEDSDKTVDVIVKQPTSETLLDDNEPDVKDLEEREKEEAVSIAEEPNTESDIEISSKQEPTVQNPAEIQNCLVERKHARGLALGQRVRNAWLMAKSSLKNDSLNAFKKLGNEIDMKSANFRLQETQDKGDQLRTPSGHLQPWPVATQFQMSTKRSHSSEDIQTVSPQVLLKNHTESLMNSLKEATLQLARRDMEMQRLIAINGQLGERYCRMRAQYMELAREQARLRQRYDMLLVKGMDREQLLLSNNQLEAQVAELQAQLVKAEERANQSTRRLGRVEAEAKDIAHSVNSADVQLANLRAEIQRKEAQIAALTCRQYMDATREMQARLILNELIELKGSMRVLIRCHEKPDEDGMFRFLGDDTLVVKPSTANGCNSPGLTNRQASPTFKVYRVFPPGAAQRAIFEEISELITACVDGYGVSLITYGQTGTGKTYTMLGAPNKPGIIPRAARHLIVQCHHRAPLWSYRLSISVVQVYKETIIDLLADPSQPTSIQQMGRISLHDNGRQILLRGCQEIEVHTEDDILEQVRKARIRRQASAALLDTSPSYLHFVVIIRVRGTSVLTSHGVDMYEQGRNNSKNRDHPPSSPFPCQMRVPRNKSKHPGELGGGDYAETNNSQLVTHGLLMLCDLAGFDTWNPSQAVQSESQILPGVHSQQLLQQPRPSAPLQSIAQVKAQQADSNRSTARPQELRPIDSFSQPETEYRLSQNTIRSAGLVLHHIPSSVPESDAIENKHLGRSLTAFARVMDALVDSETNGKPHVPYRDAKLTHLLKPCLTGDSKCILIFTVNTQRACLEASMRSLRLASKCSLISLGQAKKNATLRGGIRTAT